MNEYYIGIAAFISFIGLGVGALFYMLGGRKDKWLRRFVGSAIIVSTVNGVAMFMQVWNPWMLAAYPLLVLGYSMGYGGDTFIEKLYRRSSVTIVILSIGVLFAFVLGGNAWWVMLYHVVVGMWSIYLGIKNPTHAAAEEFFVCVTQSLGLIIYPFIIS